MSSTPAQQAPLWSDVGKRSVREAQRAPGLEQAVSLSELQATHTAVLQDLQEKNSELVRRFSTQLAAACETLQQTTLVMAEKTTPALAHLENTLRDLRETVLEAASLVQQSPRALQESEERLAETLSLLHTMIRPFGMILLSGLLTLLAAGVYLWNEQRDLQARLGPPIVTAVEPRARPAARTSHGPR